MKRKLASVAAVAMLGLAAFQPLQASAAPDQTAKHEEVRVLVKQKDGVFTAQATDKVKQEHGVRNSFGNQGFTTEVSKKELKELKADKALEVTEVSVYTKQEVTKKRDVSAQAISNRTPWGIEAIYNNPSITRTSGGDNINIAVLDSGTSVNHPDLAANVEQCIDFTQYYSGQVNGSCVDRDGHGTHVSGSALANGGNGSGIYGVAPEADLWAYKVLGDDGRGFSDDIANAIQKAADEGANRGERVIISMSLGGKKDPLIESAVSYANSRGALVIAATGNSGPYEGSISYPAALPGAVGVANLENRQQNGTYRVGDSSSRGYSRTDGDYRIQEGDVEVSAPGSAIISTYPGNGYASLTGTSMATPHISGLAAKIWSENTSLSSSQVRQTLQARAQSNDILGGYGAARGDDYASGFGFPLVQ
ncbi:S8 family serine peptidase [Terribacillus sp. DMT04]|uniref:S8 family serine peptidase n=1 Tax=Terribacillus sp. DMT04 TaxID=2850441 RepID=UPI001C2B7DED|nr:S8 family serine peptidase [Terribacillus sp. DMT04]QXE02159.1 S8 family serine peptidase [Terribacillus sp. DMT04]